MEVSLPVVFREDTFSPGTFYGFPEGEYAKIRSDFPQVHIAWRTNPGRMELWAVGDSGRPHSIIPEIHSFMYYKVHQILMWMHYSAMNGSPQDVYEEEKKRLEERYTHAEEEMVDRLDHDHLNWQVRKNLGVHEDIVGQVPSNYGSSVAEA